MTTKCKLGYANIALCKLIFGGNASRWSFGYPWILKYLDERYDRTISHEKLRDYVDDFPLFYQTINHFIKKTSLRHFHDGIAVERQGLNFLPWSIFGLIDYSIDRINRPMSGPDGDSLFSRQKLVLYPKQPTCSGQTHTWEFVEMTPICPPTPLQHLINPPPRCPLPPLSAAAPAAVHRSRRCPHCPWLGKLPTCRQHVGPTAKSWHFWPTRPSRADTNSFPTLFLCRGLPTFSKFSLSTRGTYGVIIVQTGMY